MKLLFIIGTRPEAIKLAPVIAEAKLQGAEIFVCSTGQHKEMLTQTFSALGIAPDADLAVMREGASMTETIAQMLVGCDKIIQREKPNWVVIHGDTGSAYAGGLAGFYNRVRVAHIESGLRSFDAGNPFPEEVNRRMIAAYSALHFAPTDAAKANLLREAVAPENVLVVGNTIIDALEMVKKRISSETIGAFAFLDAAKKTILVTSHRRENLGAGLVNICAAIKEIAAARADAQFIFPVHLNPKVQEVVHVALGNVANVFLTPPLDYISMVYLLGRSYLVLTDSGGIQEEASAFSLPALVLRDFSERMEGIEAGVAKLVGTDREKIVAATNLLLDNAAAYKAMQKNFSPYGDGFAAKRIIEKLMQTR